MSNDSGGVFDPSRHESSHASDGQPPPIPSLPLHPTPLFSSQYSGFPCLVTAFCMFSQYVPALRVGPDIVALSFSTSYPYWLTEMKVSMTEALPMPYTVPPNAVEV